MESIKHFFDLLMNSEKIIQSGSVLLIFLIVFLETGVIFTFYLPGDYMLFLAGMYCTSMKINIQSLAGLIVLAAILGYILGYFIGRQIGSQLYTMKDSRFFKRKHLESTEFFFHKYGKKSLIFCRFLPIIRTFMPVIAGIIKFPFGIYMIYNVVSGVAWVSVLVLGGYYLVDYFPNIKDYVQYIVMFFFAITSFTVINSWWQIRKNMRKDAISVDVNHND